MPWHIYGIVKTSDVKSRHLSPAIYPLFPALQGPEFQMAVLTSTHNLCFEQKYEKY